MAFVSRATRPLKTNEDTATLANIGPGSYIRPDYKSPEHGYAPFSSTTERTTKIGAGPSYNPAPGDYEKPVKWAASHIGESAFKSRVERLKAAENPSIAPGCVLGHPRRADFVSPKKADWNWNSAPPGLERTPLRSAGSRRRRTCRQSDR